MNEDFWFHTSMGLLSILGVVTISPLLRRLRIWNRRRMLKNFNEENGTTITELKMFGEELKPQ